MRVCPNCKSRENTHKIKEEEFLIVKCTNCGLTYLLNPPNEKEIYEDYYTIGFTGKDYSENSDYPHLREIHEINSQRKDLIQKIKRGRENFKLLDIGCGTGLFLKSCKDAGIEGEGADVSQNALNFARNEFGLNVFSKKVEEIAAEGKKYELITMWHVLEHMLEPAEEIKKIKELLTDDGLLLIEVPNLNSIKFRLSGKKWKGGNHPLYHRSFFTAKTLRETLKRGGFADVRRIKFSYILSNKSFTYNLSKTLFNVIGADAFLNFAAYKQG